MDRYSIQEDVPLAQCVKKVLSDSLGLVDFPVSLVDSVPHL